MMTRLVAWISLLLISAAAGQMSSSRLPCDYSGDLLRTVEGKVVRYISPEMKKRATHKVDIDDLFKQWDVRITSFVEILVGTAGNVECVQTLEGSFQPLRAEVERALRSWTFKRANVDGKPVSYLGYLEFRLCNIMCGANGASMTLLR